MAKGHDISPLEAAVKPRRALPRGGFSTRFKEGNPYRFPKGRSGNPEGKHRETGANTGSRALGEAYRRALAQPVPGDPDKTYADLLARSLLIKASRGSVAAMKELREGSELAVAGGAFGIALGTQIREVIAVLPPGPGEKAEVLQLEPTEEPYALPGGSEGEEGEDEEPEPEEPEDEQPQVEVHADETAGTQEQAEAPKPEMPIDEGLLHFQRRSMGLE